MTQDSGVSNATAELLLHCSRTLTSPSGIMLISPIWSFSAFSQIADTSG